MADATRRSWCPTSATSHDVDVVEVLVSVGRPRRGRAVADRARERQGHAWRSRRRSPAWSKELRVRVGDQVSEGDADRDARGRRGGRGGAAAAPAKPAASPRSRRAAAAAPAAAARAERRAPRARAGAARGRAATRPSRSRPSPSRPRRRRRAARAREPVGAPARARARRRPARSCRGTGPQGPHHAATTCSGYVKSVARAGRRARACRSPASRWRAPPRDRLREVRARPSSSRCTASASSPRRTCTAAGSRSRTSRSSTRPTSPSSTRSARQHEGRGRSGAA